LRDAENELTPGRKSRLAQILKAHPAFHKDVGEEHELERIMSDANEEVEIHFTDDGDKKAAELLETINGHLSNFFSPKDEHKSNIKISGSALHDILQRLSLVYGNESPGLGSLNLLYMAAELLLLQAGDDTGLRLTIIEELEAHLHPQAQLRLIKYLQSNTPGQLILTTHSTTLASCLKLESLIICKDGKAFPMGSDYTNLERKHYDYLERFLDATKANLFFAKAVVMVEGDAENIVLPTIAECLDRPLHQYGVSIVNVGSTAFLHYAKIFSRKDGQQMGIKAAIITDLDIKPKELCPDKSQDEIENEKKEALESITERYDADGVKTFVSHNWTLEYEIALSGFAFLFLKSVLESDKIQNAQTGQPQPNAYRRALKWAAKLWRRWEKDGQDKESIATKIYWGLMLKEGDLKKKKISKAIVAQCFSRILDAKRNKYPNGLRARLLCPELKYLSDAIGYVTEEIEEPQDD
jgi:putative ATP-dependent endonuclease of OLD family